MTYQLEELLGTKLRALYQRSKGRELKAQDKKFRNDIEGPIRPGLKYDFERAYNLVVSELVSKI